MRIKDIYAGKPDAKDEITYCDNFEDFERSLIIPEQLDVSGLIDGDKCYITGYKGTGKTALLFYLDMSLRHIDQSACSSYIFFKEDFSDMKRTALEELSKRIISSISFNKDVLVDGNNFEYIWRWLLFKRICSDNDDNNGGLFIDDENWQRFSDVLSQIKSPSKKKHSIIPDKIKLSLSQKFADTTELKPEVELDLNSFKSDDVYRCFTEIIDAAEECFSKVKRTNIPYYIFVDELEAYYGDNRVFCRDLMLIRDLVFSVRRFNTLFKKAGHNKTKIICSVRTEVLNAISNNVQTFEINKIIEGFQVSLLWNYTNTNSYKHPIIQILLKRIAISDSNEVHTHYFDGETIFRKWFPDQVNGIDTVNYILNNSWCKPRDIVRLISAAQNSIFSDSDCFSQAVFDAIRKEFSRSSLEEIREEMRALYSSDEIGLIVNCFTGFKSVFSYAELLTRIKQYFGGTVLERDTNSIVKDLYRIGFLGNYSKRTKKFRWNYKGDQDVIIADEWFLFVHRALQPALSVENNFEDGLRRKKRLQSGQTVEATVIKRKKDRIIVNFEFDGKVIIGSYLADPNLLTENAYAVNPLCKGDQIVVKLVRYNKKYSSWDVKRVRTS